MTQLSPEQIADYRQWNDHLLLDKTYVSRATRVVRDLLDHIAAQDTRIVTLIQQVSNQATELEDTAAAYQLAQRQLDACRRGQGTYEGITR